MKVLYQDNEVVVIDRECNILDPILVIWSNGSQGFAYDKGFSESKIACANSSYKNIYEIINHHNRKKFKTQKFLCLDCETTGLDYNDDEILSLSIVNQDGEVLFDELFRPEHHTSWDNAQLIHGITPADVENKPFLKDRLNHIKMILDQYQLIIGYNIDFDLGFIAQGFGVLFIKDVIGNDCVIKDVMKMFAPIYGESNKYGYKWQTLETCANYYNYKYKTHNSLEDVKATIYCYKKIMEQELYLFEV